LDLEAAVGLIREFDQPAACIIKHNSPCGVAVEENIKAAFDKAFEADSVSAFGGIVALNQVVGRGLAEKLVGPFLECVIAPDFEPAALEILAPKKNLRVLSLASLQMNSSIAIPNGSEEVEVRSMRGGLLSQTVDGPIKTWDEKWKVIGGELNKNTISDLLFGLRVVKHVKSNAIVVVHQGQTKGLCGGQTNRIDSVKMALERATKKGSRGQGLVMASDAFFPFRDSVDLAAQFGVKWIIQPGGSLKDKEVEQAALDHGIGMVITGQRHFKH
jgi:phosphoribosylaminoimidazolecarboxamide formyltransferase/IMP cyclohydrolase